MSNFGITTHRAIQKLDQSGLSSEDATSLQLLVHVKASKAAAGGSQPGCFSLKFYSPGCNSEIIESARRDARCIP